MNYQPNQKLFCITGSSGHLGSELIKLFEKRKIKFIEFKIPRPTEADINLKNFYSKHINEFLVLNKHVDTIINCAASLKPKNYKEFYFNSYFPILFQESSFRLNEHSTFINISSTRIFKNSTDKYSLSKKDSEKIKLEKNVKKQLLEFRKYIEKNCKDVGDNFPQEARRIHYDKKKSKGIYGRATPEETEELLEEGIDISTFPWVSKLEN